MLSVLCRKLELDNSFAVLPPALTELQHAHIRFGKESDRHEGEKDELRAELQRIRTCMDNEQARHESETKELGTELQRIKILIEQLNARHAEKLAVHDAKTQDHFKARQQAHTFFDTEMERLEYDHNDLWKEIERIWTLCGTEVELRKDLQRDNERHISEKRELQKELQVYVCVTI